MKKTIYTFMVLVLIVGSLVAQEKKNIPAQISLVYPIGTSGRSSIQYQYNFSLNILTGSVGSIKGCEIGGLFNKNIGYVTGFQVAGLGNVTKGNVQGMQAAGLMNISNDVKGFQVAGIFNITQKSVMGMQASGIFSSTKQLSGYQVSGIFNSTESAEGLQTAGIMNIATSIEGVQIAGIFNSNTENIRGVQISGILNQTKRLHGFQLSLINYADTIKRGIQLGLIPIIRKGFYDEVEISIADYMNIGASYKAGQKRFYNIYSLGYNFLKDDLFIFGAGFGHIKQVSEKFSFRPEIIYYAYLPNDFKKVRYTNSNHLKLGMVFNIDKKLALSFVPSIYCAIKDRKDGQYGYELSPINPIWSNNGQNSRVELGVGFSIGLSIM